MAVGAGVGGTWSLGNCPHVQQGGLRLCGGLGAGATPGLPLRMHTPWVLVSARFEAMLSVVRKFSKYQ